MNRSLHLRTLVLGVVGAVIGGWLGYLAFFWIATQGFYALVLPGGLLGLGAGLCARRRSVLLAVVCGIAGLALGLYTEWRFEPFVADKSLTYFLGHLQLLRPLTLIMVALGGFVSFRLALGRDRSRDAG
jgi:hypothetical protein